MPNLENFQVTDTEIKEGGIQGIEEPVLYGDPTDNKKLFDRLVTVLIKKYNKALEYFFDMFDVISDITPARIALWDAATGVPDGLVDMINNTANEAKTIAGEAKDTAGEAKDIAESAKTLATETRNMLTEVGDKIFLTAYPVGSIYMSTSPANPSTVFGGTWESWGTGRIPIGVDTSQSEFNTVEKTGGAKTHKLTVSEMPQHGHEAYSSKIGTGISLKAFDFSKIQLSGKVDADAINNVGTSVIGESKVHNNMPPYITCYMWKRIPDAPSDKKSQTFDIRDYSNVLEERISPQAGYCISNVTLVDNDTFENLNFELWGVKKGNDHLLYSNSLTPHSVWNEGYTEDIYEIYLTANIVDGSKGEITVEWEERPV